MDKSIDLGWLFEHHGYNYNEILDKAYSSYIMQSVKEILYTLKLEFKNIKVGYYAICENPLEHEIEYVIDKKEDTVIKLTEIFDSIIKLQKKYEIRLGIMYLWLMRGNKEKHTEMSASAGVELNSEIIYKRIEDKVVWL